VRTVGSLECCGYQHKKRFPTLSTTRNRANMHVYQLMVSMRFNCNTCLMQYIIVYAYSPNMAHLHQSRPTPDILFTFSGQCIVIYLRNKDRKYALFFLNLFQQSILYVFQIH